MKLNTVKKEFKDKNVLLVDDSIVRGTTAKEIVEMARDAGAKKVFFSSAAPPIRYPNIYGIDIPTRQELVAYERNEEEIAKVIGCDWIVYQDLKDLESSVESCAPANLPLNRKYSTPEYWYYCVLCSFGHYLCMQENLFLTLEASIYFRGGSSI
jgi:amidophosphoribosyltransferase